MSRAKKMAVSWRDPSVRAARLAHYGTREERFWNRVKKTNSHWLWIGATVHGHGRINHRWAHRESWEMHHGPIPAGYDVHHHCRVKLCVKPSHLRLMTTGDHHKIHNRERKVK